MHRCLAIDEVLCDILWQVDDKGSLYHAALVCRAFLEPANKSLWYHLQNLYHLVNLLPAHLLEDYDYRLTILSPPSPADWRRFTHHGRYVKFLEIWGWEAGGCFIDENAFKIIAEHHPGPFLPNLMHLSWSDRGLVEYAPLVMPPTLITLRSVGYIPLAGILDRVVTNTPRLKRLTFCDDSSEILDGDELADAIKAHDQWTTLEEVVLRSDAFVHLSRIPHLTTLSVALTEDDHDCVQVQPVPSDWACRLEAEYPLSPLKKLDLASSRFAPAAVHDVATYLARLFPHADLVHDKSSDKLSSHRSSYGWSAVPSAERRWGATFDIIREKKEELAPGVIEKAKTLQKRYLAEHARRGLKEFPEAKET
ncbi:hypothetical protein PsYK624_141020 [Phanerochaete sordida]|uniref:F-box domain-containing protein n=1 Tax=Phanerochaete sordida TaxID=48140 RepID=A0A9P3GM48_9APHY|nr:hypothetical protein PsYK624_141020 [Phanerochaete sordida]